MKIGILTFHRSQNYGAFFQAYALQTVLQEQGHQAEIIDYFPAYRRKPWGPALFPLPPARQFHNPARYGISVLFAAYKNTLNLRERLKRYRLFTVARRRYLQLSTAQYDTPDQLRAAGSAYDILLAGSDQIWNPKLTGNRLDPAYFLAFAECGRPSATYAASLGGAALPPEHLADFRKFIGHVGAISLREKSAAAFVEQESGKPTVAVVDPTLLLPRAAWDRLAAPPPAPPRDFILFYRLVAGQQTSLLVKRMARELQLPVVHVGLGASRGRARESFVPPEQFLWYFAHARFVITDSFHGAMFSVIFRKPFYAIADHPANVRIVDHLDPLGLAGRVFASGAAVDQTQPAIEYEAVAGRLEARRQQSLAFLADLSARAAAQA